MQITLNSSEDFRQLFNIVKLVNEEFGNYSHSLHEQIKVLQNREEKYQTEIDELKQKVCDKDAIINGHICEINQMYGTLSDLEKEKQALATLNSALSDEIEQIKTQQNCDEVIDLRDTNTTIDDLRAELKTTIEENNKLKKELAYYASSQS